MRKVFASLLLLASVCTVLRAQSYDVISPSSKVEVRTSDTTKWTALKLGAKVYAKDSIRINTGGKLKILNSVTRQSFLEDSSLPAIKVADFISGHSKKKESTLLLALKEGANNLIKKEKVNDNYTGGAVPRAGVRSGDKIARDIITYINNPEMSYVSEELSMKEHRTPSGEIWFSIENLSDRVVFPNIVAYDPSVPAAVLCYRFDEVGIVLEPGSKIDLDMITFMKGKNTRYILFGTSEEIDAENIQEELDWRIESNFEDEPSGWALFGVKK